MYSQTSDPEHPSLKLRDIPHMLWEGATHKLKPRPSHILDLRTSYETIPGTSGNQFVTVPSHNFSIDYIFKPFPHTNTGGEMAHRNSNGAPKILSNTEGISTRGQYESSRINHKNEYLLIVQREILSSRCYREDTWTAATSFRWIKLASRLTPIKFIWVLSKFFIT